MFQVKICGITSASDGSEAVSAGADAIGLNFFAGSPRFVTPQQADAIVGQLASSVATVGVFVDAESSRISDLWHQLSLDFVQLHGHESPESLAELPSEMRLIRVYRWGASSAKEIGADLDACRECDRLPAAVLIDAYDPGALGGTGKQVAWHELAGDRPWLLDRPLVLAGGLTPQNVGEAIAVAQPAAVDTASGVEQSPGRKDRHRMQEFVTQARQAWKDAGQLGQR